ncbi:hypothetical protein ACSRUE_14080 [Sorangium sp. KYC3313]|uniref:hypothetical protein n=1 Tax=Sorangium sp. KYC3313 TaxID=3449740 RepID=UPI003F898875
MDLVRHGWRLTRIVILVLNIVIVAYLSRRARRAHRSCSATTGGDTTLPLVPASGRSKVDHPASSTNRAAMSSARRPLRGDGNGAMLAVPRSGPLP